MHENLVSLDGCKGIQELRQLCLVFHDGTADFDYCELLFHSRYV